MTQQLFNLVKKLGKYWKVFDDRYVFNDGWFYPSDTSTFNDNIKLTTNVDIAIFVCKKYNQKLLANIP